MWFRSLFDALKTRSSCTAARRTPPKLHTCRPRVEALEKRLLLTLSPAVNYPVAPLPLHVLAGDFNNDRAADLLVAHGPEDRRRWATNTTALR